MTNRAKETQTGDNLYRFPENARLLSLKQGGPGDGGGMDIEIERRLTAIETTLPHLATRADIADTKTELARAEERIKGKLETDFRIQFGALITVAVGLASLIAAGFGWLK